MSKKSRAARLVAEQTTVAATSEPSPEVVPVPETDATTEATTEPTTGDAKGSRIGLGLCGLPAMRRMDFQDALLEANREWKFTDSQLAILMQVEHPRCNGRIDVAIVRGIRRLFNAGKHTKNQAKPAVASVAYDAEGRELSARGKVVAAPVVVENEPVENVG